MNNIFIGWSGNKKLAEAVGRAICANTNYRIVLGGGRPEDMFIGAQIIEQMNKCDTAILLVEDKDGSISRNLMFEWGYIVAKYSVARIHAFLINKTSQELPSDLLGSWVNEVTYDKQKDSVTSVAERIAELFVQSANNIVVSNYFDLISKWKQIFAYLSDDITDSNQAVCEYILSGCLAAYYYQDNRILRQTLNSIAVPPEINIVVQFAKAYVDVFLNSNNMTTALSEQDFFGAMQTFETVLNRKKNLSDDVEMLLDILSYDAYGLACTLFMKNRDLDENTRQFCSEKAKYNFEKDIQLLTQFENTFKNNVCLGQLLRSYIYNDIGHLYRDAFDDRATYLKYLTISVEERKSLYQTFVLSYPDNSFLATKLEQEYIIALSEQCNYMENSVLKNMYKSSVIAKYQEWEKELVYTRSLTDRIKNNIQKFE